MSKESSSSPLDNLTVASPCPVSWDSMELSDDERKRFCNQCSKHVFDISNMTRTEAENLLLNSSSRVCVSYYKRSDGKVMTDDCPAALKALRKRYRKVAAAITGIICSLFSISQASAQNAEPVLRTMGEACVVPPGPQANVYDKSPYAKKNTSKLFNLAKTWVSDSNKKLKKGSFRLTVTNAGKIEDCVIITSTGDTKIDALLVKEIKKTKLAKFTGKERKFLLLDFSKSKKS